MTIGLSSIVSQVFELSSTEYATESDVRSTEND